MNLLRTLRRLFPARPARRPQARPRVRPLLEALEDRAVPTAYTWVGPAGGAWGAGANWENALTHTVGQVPGPTDDALFGAPGADTSCLVNGSFAADRVVMGGDYDQTLTVPAGSSLAAATLFQQSGTLALSGGSVSSGNDFFVNGAVTASGGSTSRLAAGAGLFLRGGPITVAGMTMPGVPLLALSGAVEDAADITVGSPATGMPGSVQVTGSLTVDPNAVITLNSATGLTFVAGTPASVFDVQGTIVLYQATVTTNVPLDLDGGTLLTAAAANADRINGSVRNEGAITWAGAALHPLTISGDYTQGASGGAAGALNLRVGGGSSDRLSVGGEASLAGTLSVSDQGSMSPSLWTLLSAAAISGDFDAVDLPAGWHDDLNPDSVTVQYEAAISGDFDTVGLPAGWHYPVNPASVTVQNI